MEQRFEKEKNYDDCEVRDEGDIMSEINYMLKNEAYDLITKYGYITKEEFEKEWSKEEDPYGDLQVDNNGRIRDAENKLIEDISKNEKLRETILRDENSIKPSEMLALIKEFKVSMKYGYEEDFNYYMEQIVGAIYDSVTLPFNNEFLMEMEKTLNEKNQPIEINNDNEDEVLQLLNKDSTLFKYLKLGENFHDISKLKEAILGWFRDSGYAPIEGVEDDVELHFDSLPDEIKRILSQDRDFLIRARIVENASDELKRDKGFILDLVKKDPYILLRLDTEKYRLDRDVILEGLKSPTELYDEGFLSSIFQVNLGDNKELKEKYNQLVSDSEVMLVYLEDYATCDPSILNYALDDCNWRIFGKREFVDGVRNSEKLKEHAGKEFWEQFEQYAKDFQDITDSKLNEELDNGIGEKIVEEMMQKISETKTVVTHYGDDLDNKSSIYAIEERAKVEGALGFDENLRVERVPAGQYKKGMLNIDTGGHNGTILEDNTIVIDGDIKNGIKSAAYMLAKLGVYVPRQIVELADTMPAKVSPLDSRSGLALVRYLSGEQAFELAEEEFLDKSLTDEQLDKFGLAEAHQKQQSIIDNALKKIQLYTKTLPNGEKIVLAPEQILGGSAIAYETGVNYYASAADHFDKNGEKDGITFAITSKPGVKLPDNVISYGKQLEKKYSIDGKTSGVFVNPNSQMIVAGGFKNPEFKIEGENVNSILTKIEKQFIEREIEER